MTIDYNPQRMTRNEAVKYAHQRLADNELKDWTVRLTTDISKNFLGLCSYRDKAIILSGQHIDIHDASMIKNTINHEVAHALTPGHAHDEVWVAKAKELGCYETKACASIGFTEEAIDAIRSGATLE